MFPGLQKRKLRIPEWSRGLETVARLMGERTKCRFRFSGPGAGSPHRPHGPYCKEGWDFGSPRIRTNSNHTGQKAHERSWLQTLVNPDPSSSGFCPLGPRPVGAPSLQRKPDPFPSSQLRFCSFLVCEAFCHLDYKGVQRGLSLL